MDDHHFMSDPAVIRKIMAALPPRPGTILEIGAGHGELTACLAQKLTVIAIEKDRELFAFVKAAIGNRSAVTLIRGNALRLLPKLRFDTLVANLPYSICEPLFRRLPFIRFSAAYVTLPRRFAARLSRLPYNVFFRTTVLFPVPRTAFSPPPRTASVFVRVDPAPETLLKGVLLQQTSKVKNALRTSLVRGGMSRQEAKREIALSGIDSLLEKRVSDLNVAAYTSLERILERLKYGSGQ